MTWKDAEAQSLQKIRARGLNSWPPVRKRGAQSIFKNIRLFGEPWIAE
jgi:hypothetical protein